MKTLIIILISINCLAQCPESLTTTYSLGNGQDGNMFDIQALNDITIDYFDGSYGSSAQSGTWEIYYKSGSHVGYEDDPAAWTFAGSSFVQSSGPHIPTRIPITINLSIPAGETYAFYVTVASGDNLHYTNGTGIGNIAAQDANLIVKEGTANIYPFFWAVFYPRIWNGTIHYTTNCQVLRTLEYVSNTFCWSDFTPPDCVTQRITINEGWNLISTYLDMTNVGIDQIFGIIPDVLIVKNGSGQAYIQSLGINTIGNWNQKDGYKIKAIADVIFDMCFTTNLDNSISLPAGWSLISVLSDVPVDPVSLFNGTSLLICKNIAGQSYIPSLGINTIGDLQPSQGYKVKMGTADVITY